MEKLLPQNIEAECGVLGSIIIDPEAIVQVSDFLEPEDFYRDAHRTIYEVIVHLYQGGEPADFITICDELERRNRLEDVGGASYITSLINQVPTSGNVEYYGHIVERTSTLRRLIHAAGQIAALAYEEGNADIALDKAERLIFEISQRHSRSDFASMEEILAAYMTRLEQLNARRGSIIGVPTGFTDLDRMTGGLQRSDLIVLAARPGIGKCLPAHTLIDDPATGERLTIEACVQRRLPAIYGLSSQGLIRLAQIHAWVDSGRQPCYRVRTRTGREVEVTGHHPFLSTAGWTALCELRVGDHIALARQVPTFGRDDSWPLARVRLLAYLLAQSSSMDQLPTFTSADPVLRDDFAQILADYYPACTLKQEGPTWRIVEPERASLAGWLSELGLMGRSDGEMFLPGCVWRWERSRLAELLCTLISCADDTAVLRPQPIALHTKARQLAADVQHALVRFGIVSTLTQTCEATWHLQVTSALDARIYQEEIGWIGARAGSGMKYAGTLQAGAAHRASGRRGVEGARDESQQRSATDVLDRHQPAPLSGADIYWDAIAAIEPVGPQHVYDLTVPDGQNFIAQDIFVHNTSLALSMAHNTAVKYKQAVAIFSLEMSKEQLAQRLLSMDAGIDQQRMRTGWIEEDEWERIVTASDKLSEARIWIDDTAGISTMEMRSKARRLQTEQGVDLVIVDYLQLMQSSSTGRNDNRVQEVSEISRSLKGLARELNVPVVALAQLSRSVESRQSKVPQLSDLRESGCITGDSLLYLPDTATYQPIAHFIGQRGFRVLALNTETWQLEPRAVTHAFATGRKRVHRLTTRLGRSIRATANHRFLTKQGWQRLDQLLAGMHLALPRWLPGAELATLSAEELALLAYLVDDSATWQAHAIEYTTRELVLAETVVAMATAVCAPGSVSPPMQTQQCYQVSLARDHRPATVDAWCQRSGLSMLEQCVPAQVFAQPTRGIAQFLRHLWASGGQICECEEPVPPLAYVTRSRRLAGDVQSLLLRFGIQATLARHVRTPDGQDCFQVQIERQADIACFLARIGTPGQHTMRCASQPGSREAEAQAPQRAIYWDQIQSIEVEGEEEVYDLTVDEAHNFIANNFILHNSIEQDSDIVLFIYREDVYNPESERKNIANLILAKHRNGPVGEVSLYFQPNQTRFRDLEITSTEE
ncbi:MAG TPA: replicative DNA helicase [Ktedonobacteraceae bacterium]